MSHQTFPRAARSASLIGDDNIASPGALSITAMLDVSAVPGTDTVQLVVEGKDPALGKYYPVLSATARAAVGTDVLTIARGIATVANVSANAVVPSVYRVRVVHSAGSAFTYALSVREG